MRPAAGATEKQTWLPRKHLYCTLVDLGLHGTLLLEGPLRGTSRGVDAVLALHLGETSLGPASEVRVDLDKLGGELYPRKLFLPLLYGTGPAALLCVGVGVSNK
jgi:hypothetical protein